MGKTTTKDFCTIVRIPKCFTFKGNDSGCAVKAVTSPTSPGDGDINTGHGGYVFAFVSADCRKQGRYAMLDFEYRVQNSNWCANSKADCLEMKTSGMIDLGMYDYSPKSWSYVNEKNQKVTVQERFTYRMGTHNHAYYATVFDAKKKLTGWMDIAGNDPGNQTQSWIPKEGIRVKVDDSGSELLKVGNIAFQVHVIITIHVYRTVTTTIEDPVEDTAQAILSMDRALPNPTIDGIVANRPVFRIEDGARNFANQVIHDEGSTGAWLRGTRDPNTGIISYAFPYSPTNYTRSTEYYLGSILVVDNNFRTPQPTVINFREGERKTLDVFSTIGRKNCHFENVLPTAKEMNNKKNDFVQEYRDLITEETKLGSNTTVRCMDFDSADGISIGGSIKGVDFGFTSAECKKKVRVFEFRQVLYSLSLNDTYTRASDFFTDQFDLDAFRKKIQHYSPAIISTVNFGRTAYLAVASDDDSAMSINISKADVLKGDVKLGGSAKKCTFKTVLIGGVAGTMNGNMNLSSYDEAIKFVNSIGKEMTAVDVEAAVPIEFEAKFLGDLSKKVTTDVLPYFSKYVDKVYINIVDQNTGISASAKLRFFDMDYDSRGERDYVFRSYDKKLDFKVACSPWATCFEIKVDIAGANGDYDFNVFIPYIPLAALRQDDQGDWVFKVYIGGTTMYDAKNKVTMSASVPGCYVSKTSKLYRGNLSESSYKGQSEDYLLAGFFNDCELRTTVDSRFQRLTSEKKIKCYRSND